AIPCPMVLLPSTGFLAVPAIRSGSLELAAEVLRHLALRASRWWCRSPTSAGSRVTSLTFSFLVVASACSTVVPPNGASATTILVLSMGDSVRYAGQTQVAFRTCAKMRLEILQI